MCNGIHGAVKQAGYSEEVKEGKHGALLRCHRAWLWDTQLFHLLGHGGWGEGHNGEIQTGLLGLESILSHCHTTEGFGPLQMPWLL